METKGYPIKVNGCKRAILLRKDKGRISDLNGEKMKSISLVEKILILICLESFDLIVCKFADYSTVFPYAQHKPPAPAVIGKFHFYLFPGIDNDGVK